MSDALVNLVRSENYLLEVFARTKDSKYTGLTLKLIEFIKNIYRVLEPSHLTGKIIAFYKISDSPFFGTEKYEKLYDNSILNHNFESIIFQLFQDETKMPYLYQNLEKANIDSLLSSDRYISYYYDAGEEFIFVNTEKIKIPNNYSCPSIFALQYHFLNESLLRYKNERVMKVSCEHFKNCWINEKNIYFVNKPEDYIQLSISEYLKNSLRGVDIVREYNLNASKPVDIRIYWRESNRAALIEVKLMGKSVKSNGDLNTYEYDNRRANEGMIQIKEYIDLVNRDSPTIINKGYLIVIDGRRKNTSPKITSIPIEDGMFYANINLNIEKENQFYNSHKNIETPIRMFAEPVCN